MSITETMQMKIIQESWKQTNCPPEECPSSENVPCEPPQPHVKIFPSG